MVDRAAFFAPVGRLSHHFQAAGRASPCIMQVDSSASGRGASCTSHCFHAFHSPPGASPPNCIGGTFSPSLVCFNMGVAVAALNEWALKILVSTPAFPIINSTF
eukprot:GGOE01022183.1.p2 GENE.GGOE01022183.1~~GGOE01022183.1.p2  ORF type:complete len:104 (+),score=1.48 GGOE01022183.1:183-494(+)